MESTSLPPKSLTDRILSKFLSKVESLENFDRDDIAKLKELIATGMLNSEKNILILFKDLNKDENS